MIVVTPIHGARYRNLLPQAVRIYWSAPIFGVMPYSVTQRTNEVAFGWN